MKVKNADKSIIFLVGMPAVGKSTYISGMGWDQDPNTYIHSSDDVMMEWAEARGLTYDEAFEKVDFMKEILPVLLSRFRYAVENDMNIVVDMVNASPRQRANTLGMINKDDFIVRAVVFGHELWKAQDKQFFEKIVKAVNKRGQEQNKNIPRDKLWDFMFSIYEEPTREEGFDQINFIDPLNPIVRSNPYRG